MTKKYPFLEYAGTITLNEAINLLKDACSFKIVGLETQISIKNKTNLDLILGLCIAIGAAEEFKEETIRYQEDQSVTYPIEMRNIIRKIQDCAKSVRKKGIADLIKSLKDELDEYRRSPGYEDRLDQRKKNRSIDGHSFDYRKLYGRREFTRLYDLVRLEDLDHSLTRIGSVMMKNFDYIDERQDDVNSGEDSEYDAATARRLSTSGYGLTKIIVDSFKKR